MKQDIEGLAQAAYDAYNRSRGLIPEYTFTALPADQREAWEDAAITVVLQAAALALESAIALEEKEVTVQ